MAAVAPCCASESSPAVFTPRPVNGGCEAVGVADGRGCSESVGVADGVCGGTTEGVVVPVAGGRWESVGEGDGERGGAAEAVVVPVAGGRGERETEGVSEAASLRVGILAGVGGTVSVRFGPTEAVMLLFELVDSDTLAVRRRGRPAHASPQRHSSAQRR